MATRKRPVVLLQLANLVSGISNAVVALSFPWLALDVTGSATAAGVVAAVSAIPALLTSPITGWLIDHLGRRVVSVVSDVLSAISVAAIPVVAHFFGLTFASILILAGIGAVFDPAGYSARRALIPDASSSSGVQVDKLNGIHQGVFLVGWTGGPLVAAGLIAWLGPVQSFWLPAVLFMVAALAIAGMGVVESESHEQEAHAAELGEGPHPLLRGFTAIWNDRALRVLTFGVLALAAVYMPTETVVLPTHFNRLDEPAGLGIVIAALAGGSMVGAFSYGWLAARLKQATLVRFILLGTAISIVPMALLPALPVMTAFAFLLGLSWGPFDPLMSSLVQQRVKPNEHGRVYGAQLAAFYAAPPMGMLVAGWSVDRFGVSATYLALAVFLIVCSLIVLSAPSVRRLGQPAAVSQESSAVAGD